MSNNEQWNECQSLKCDVNGSKERIAFKKENKMTLVITK